MNSKILYFLLFSCFTFHAFSQTATDVSNEGLRGSVKSIQLESFEANRNETKPIKSIPLETYYSLYSRNGLKENTNYISSSASLSYQAHYKRDAYGNIILETISDPNSTVLGKTLFSYNAKNKISDEIIFSAYNELENVIHFFYNASGQLHKKTYYDRDRNLMETHVFLYDDKNQKIKTQITNPQGEKKTEIMYEYDESGNPIVINTFDYTLQDHKLRTDIIEYEYDSKGNWIKKNQYRVGKKHLIPYYIFERKMEYYN